MNSYDPQRGDSSDQWARKANGEIIVDRFGRPVRRNPAAHESRSDAVASPSGGQNKAYMRELPPEFRQGPRQEFAEGGGQGYGQNYDRGYAQNFGRPSAARDYQRAPENRPVHRSRPAKQRRRRRRPKFGRIFGSGLMVLVVVFAAVMLWADTKLARVDAMPDQHVANTAGTNWLLVGSDSRAGLSEAEQEELVTGDDSGSQRTDTIMLLHIPNGGRARLVSLPRDSLVNIPGYGENKINAAYAFGGAPLLIETVESNTGLRIDHYAEIGFGGFSKLVDAVGDVTLCPKEPISDPLIGLELDAGCQKMDGPTALKYVRTRHTPQGDFDRVERQREFVSAIAKKTASPATLLNPFRAGPLLTSGLELFEVDKGDHIWHLARMAWALTSGPQTETIPNGGTSDSGFGSVVLWDDSTTAYFSEMK